MIDRDLAPTLRKRLAEVPAVVLTGPRQAGKTTLALAERAGRESIYLDLESPRDSALLTEPELYLEHHLDRLVILDEIHRVPGLFPVLRGIIDRARRSGRRTGLYLLLGSASVELLNQSGETLAGRVSYLELTPLTHAEVERTELSAESHWLRGGFPESMLAPGDGASVRWRDDFIRTYLERDIPQFGPRVPAETLRRFWTMLAHRQGAPANMSELARNLGLDARTAAGYVDLMVDLLLVRRLPAWTANTGKRVTKSPRLYVRDSGIVHALLGIETRDDLLSHPIVGQSWEGYVVENLLGSCSDRVVGSYYRTAGGAEVDLLLEWPDGAPWAVEIKRSLSPTPKRGFHEARADIKPDRSFVVYPGTERFPIGDGVEAIPLGELCREAAGPMPIRRPVNPTPSQRSE